MSGSHDVVVIGAGPAGLAAAALSAQAGLDTVVFDEGVSAGGQVYRAIDRTPLRRRELLGADYWAGEALLERALASGVRIEQGTTVWSLDADRELGVVRDNVARMVQAREVIIATGALERPFPIPGWTLPGVMTAGAAQTMLKSSGVLASGQVILAGCGPLLWLLAAQMLRAGGRIALMLDTTPRGAMLRAAAHLPDFVASPLFRKGLALMREVRTRVRVISGVVAIAAEGQDSLQAVSWRCASGRAGRLEADHLFLHQGVVPNVNLAMSAGLEHRWDDLQLCWRPVLDSFGGSALPGISVAGDGAGIAGAWAAEARGRLAAIAAVRRLVGPLSAAASDASERVARDDLRRHEAGRGFLDRVYRPAPQFRVPEGDTLVCRCEEVSARQIVETVALGCEGPNQMKAFLRCGMGPCQGRLCGLTVTELIARERKLSPQAIGYYRLRPPVKPIALAALANMPVDDGAVKAVVRGYPLVRTADAIIIGAGIHGCSTAWHLAMRGIRALVIEKDHAGRHASGVNAGGVRQLARHVAEIPLSIASMAIWERIEALTGDDCGFESHGQVLVAEDESELDGFRERVADLNRRGFHHEELIDRDELRRLLPAVSEHCPGGIVSRRDGAADPFRSTQAIRRAAVREGAEFREGEFVTAIKRVGSVWSVETASGALFQAPVIVNAAGAWADRICAALGEPVPLEAVGPMLMITSRVAPFIKPVVILRSRKLSFKQFANGTVMIGGGHLAQVDRDRNLTRIDWAKLQQSARTVWELFAVMRDAQINRAWAGIEGRMKDDIPVFGRSSTAEGVFHQFGFSAHGFQLGPGAGAVMAELISTGQSSVAIDGLDIRRFGASAGSVS